MDRALRRRGPPRQLRFATRRAAADDEEPFETARGAHERACRLSGPGVIRRPPSGSQDRPTDPSSPRWGAADAALGPRLCDVPRGGGWPADGSTRMAGPPVRVAPLMPRAQWLPRRSQSLDRALDTAVPLGALRLAIHPSRRTRRHGAPHGVTEGHFVTTLPRCPRSDGTPCGPLPHKV